MSKGRSVQTTTQSVQIPEYLQNVQQEVFQAARDFQPEVFAGQRFAPTNPFETQQIQSLADFGGDMSGVQQAQGAIGNILTGGIGSPDLLRDEYNRNLDSQFLNQVINDRLADTRNAITSQFARAGRLGSDAFGTALGRGIGTAVAPILAQNERQEAARRAQLAGQIAAAERAGAGLQIQAASALPTAQNLALQRIQGIGQAGALQRAAESRPIAAEQQRIAEQTEADRQRLNALLSAAGAGNVGIGQTTTVSAPPPGLGSQLLGIGLLGTGLADFRTAFT